MTTTGRVYRGTVCHKRLRPKAHALTYRVFSMLVNVDELNTMHNQLYLFGYNRLRFFSLHDADFGRRDGKPISRYARDLLRDAGFDPAGWRIELLAYPRILGYVFNPLSVYYCYDAVGLLRVMIYEVTNTFGERTSYVLPANASANGVHAHSCAKQMYVSPFAATKGRYSFRITKPGNDLLLGVQFRDSEGPLIKTYFKGSAEAVSDGVLAKLAILYPLMTGKVIVAIHVEALKLFFKRIPFIRRPAASRFAVATTRGSKGA